MSSDYYKYKGDLSPAVKRQAKKAEDAENQEQKPWHQQPGETDRAYSAFTIYLDIGAKRSQRIVSKVLYGQDRVADVVKEWSKEYDWVKRAEAFDRFISESHIANMEKAVRETEEHALRYLLDVVKQLTDVARGESDVTRSQMRAMDSFLDRFGPAKQRSQSPINVNNFNVTAPQLPKETTKNLLSVEEADFEVLEDQASNLIPEKLRKK